jgi:hypothetical protein
MKIKNVILLLFFTISLPAYSFAVEMSEFPGPWNTESNLGISKTLIANKIRGCGEYKFKVNRRFHNEYLVYCSADGKNWVAYLVWPLPKMVEGPFRPDLP